MCETHQLMVVTRGDGCETSLLHDSKLVMILHSISTPQELYLKEDWALKLALLR